MLTFTSPLPGDRYRIDVNAALVTGLAGHLDGHWVSETNGTLYDWTDDPKERTFLSTAGNGMGGSDFQFKFALLPGDYNQNGVVEAADYVAWRFAPGIDGDGDGNPNQIGDYNVWRDAYASLLWFQSYQGDYNHDGAVNVQDYYLWRMELGNTLVPDHPEYTAADGSGNGIVDAADYVTWALWNNSFGAWYDAVPGFGAGISIIDSTDAPHVVNVTISGFNSTHDPYSFASHVGSGDQLRTVPVGGADTISITFDEEVNVEASFLRVVGLWSGFVPTLVDFSYDPLTMTATWRFENLTANDQYLISLSDAVTNTEGYRLDGEWVNPVSLYTTNSVVSEFPSGDGHAGGAFNFVMTLLAGDANRDGIVDGTDEDILLVGFDYGLADWFLFTDADFTGDGAVMSEDYDLLYATWGANLQSAWMQADLNGDWKVNDTDLQTLAGNMGMSNPTHADGDLNGDGQIDTADADLMFAQYGMELAVVS